MRKTLVQFSEEVISGVNPDLGGAPDKAPLWVDGRNVVFEDGQVRPMVGQFIYAGLPDDCIGLPGTGITEIIQGGAKVLFWGSPSRSADSCQGRLLRWEELNTTVVDVSRVAAIQKVAFAGIGTNDLTTGGAYTGDAEEVYDVEIVDAGATPQTFRWKKQSSGSYEATANLSTTLISLANGDGVQVKWNSTTGHQAGDTWTFAVNPHGYVGTGVWSLAVWGEQVIATNGVDRPQIYGYTGATTKFQDICGIVGSSGLLVSDRANIAETMGPFIFLVNLNTNNQALRWGDEDSAIVWNPLAANFAGDLAVRALNSEIIAVSRLGGLLAVYGEDQVHGVAFVGGQLVHSQRHLVDNIGAISSQAVVSVGMLNYGMGRRGFWQTNGNTAKYLDQDRVHDFVYQNLNLDAVDQICSWVSPTASTIHWSVPLYGATNNNITVAYNFRYDAWSIMDYGVASATSGVIFPSTRYVATNGSPLEESPEASGLSFGSPVILTPGLTYNAGYGVGGYGQGGYGTGVLAGNG